MSDSRFFKVLDHVGLDPDGNLEPLVEVGVTVPRVTTDDGEPVQLDDRVILKPLDEGGRIFATDDPIIAEGLNATGLVEEISQPTKAQIEKDKQNTSNGPSRTELDARAEELGVEAPQKLPNKDAVIAAIQKAETAQAAGSNVNPGQEA